ncbi:putative ABC-type molybdenum transporter, ATP-binding protein [Pedobacter cryoconitis]|uniref:Putative ABC-type molybdenum transporter, ATP-binding protein n=1 Tax=Pedobacter cryoconitis TaxID=188932 RepID=A0A127VKJ3_9SPHI|nr:ATP-binding cassette domain-containing protein [Pedobacter cryoconitis]AMQ01823.1 putative ABC-type molybdenum transporter, ATP-binding protein [Pedobacter cryoconitis]
MTQPIVHITNLNLKYHHKPVLQELNWTIKRHENWLLRGISGSGKTSLAKAIAGLVKFQGDIEINFDTERNLAPTVHYVANWYQFKDLEGQSNFYYQQRYNKQATETTATVRAELESYGKKHQLQFSEAEQLLAALGFSDLIDSTLIQLSSGEHKKLQLVSALWLKPQLLIIDQPYNGLDKLSRHHLNLLFEEITAAGTTLILISNDKLFPPCVHRFGEISGGQLIEISANEHTLEFDEQESKPIPDFLKEAPVSSADSVIRMIDVNVSYGEKQVLKNINWEVKAGEKWLLQGPNGSGKSTLLSLITGDHPQAYANNLYLFGHQRGSGESIWDIKKRIGLISPELHWYFDPLATVKHSIISGFFDSSGLFREADYTKKTQAAELIDYFGLTEYQDTLLNQLPLGKQRLAFLARTIIKNPELLILDEPCQGLDQQQTQYFNKLVDELCKNGTTLIYVGHFETQLPACIEKRILLENGEVKSAGKILEPVLK